MTGKAIDEIKEVLKDLPFDAVINKIRNYDIELKDVYSIDDLIDYFNNTKNKSSLLNILAKSYPETFTVLLKTKRSPNEKARDENFNLYAFLETEELKEVEIEDETYYKKELGFENLIKIDLYKPSDLNMINMMKLRSQFQPGTKLYAVYVPNYMLGEDNYYNVDDLSKEEKDYIKEYKFKI